MVAADPSCGKRRADNELIVAVRSSLVEDVVHGRHGGTSARSARPARAQASAKGQIERKTLLRRMTVGRWRLEIEIERLEVRLRAGTPRPGRGPPRAGPAAPLRRSRRRAESPCGSRGTRPRWPTSCAGLWLARELSGRTAAGAHDRQHLSAGRPARRRDRRAGGSRRRIRLKVDLSPVVGRRREPSDAGLADEVRLLWTRRRSSGASRRSRPRAKRSACLASCSGRCASPAPCTTRRR
jgi:hypothetical protein